MYLKFGIIIKKRNLAFFNIYKISLYKCILDLKFDITY